MAAGVRCQRITAEEGSNLPSIDRIRQILGIPSPRQAGFIESIPFSPDDATAGSENELQAAVSGSKECVDLPLVIERSNYFANIIKRSSVGDTSRKAVTALQEFLDGNSGGLWENSWVRFPSSQLSAFARNVLNSDLLMDKKNPNGRSRGDADKFLCYEQGQEFLRVPISYILKLSLADVIGSQGRIPELIHRTGTRLMSHLLNDNTSPETFSFHVVPLRLATGFGRALAKETSKRYALTQLLIMYANEKFSLREKGQKGLLYFSPHPPIRQKRLNECISDSFYRELFMSPCLSGWDNGEDKHAYMCLCHQVLSRSQLNGVAKLREAGIITRNLVVLPNVSNISLANNGTHISLGSAKLTDALADESSGFAAADEKFLGDLVIKIVEHFLPLFVGTYSAAPYRLGFSDFHPERVLSFLPHELDYTHLRMIWRRWKKKASLKIFGRPMTPFGIEPLDDVLSVMFRAKGDVVPDFRLIDYLVAVMSSNESPALDGKLGNSDRLKKDLSDLGVFDEKMSLYQPYRLREFATVGFSGFEGRHYSLFESLEHDMARAADLQTLVTALAFKYVLQGKVTHSHIPDDPFIESERRQIFFGSAIGLPTFFVFNSTGNLFMRTIIERTKEVRYSRRYPGYLRVYNRQYRLALTNVILKDGSDLIEMLNLTDTVEDLIRRLEKPEEFSVSGKLTREILRASGTKTPLSMSSEAFNFAAEEYYRTTMKKRHLLEGLNFLHEDLQLFDSGQAASTSDYREAIRYSIENRGACEFLDQVKDDVLNETAPLETLTRLIDLVLITFHRDIASASRQI
ncbi:MAG: hypothetical protein WBG50_15585 [Desulfomonilaceae bacterium]